MVVVVSESSFRFTHTKTTQSRKSTPKLPLVLMERRAEVASPITALCSLAISRPLHIVGITSATLPVDMPRLVSRKPLQLGQ